MRSSDDIAGVEKDRIKTKEEEEHKFSICEYVDPASAKAHPGSDMERSCIVKTGYLFLSFTGQRAVRFCHVDLTLKMRARALVCVTCQSITYAS